ncbi:hypothetical protein [Streptomyces anulatus]|uniref:hypothetical protein n=1 Tax=Streptomyces anulatus TaxID=1892 RepID=UPI0022560495|nr:hypothetical protein [Streptomyces anulatus]MCX4504295.1 hypothetical protein [Streptomyces anulatus]
MPEKKIQHWAESLADSVYALYETANEYRTAHRAAEVAVTTVDFLRRMTHEGRIGLEGPTAGYGRASTRSPHGQALTVLHRLYGTVESETAGRYEEAALLYASGAAWAVRAVQRGERPPVVVFRVDDHGDPAPHSMDVPGLDTWVDGPALDAAYNTLRRCMDAAEYGEDLADRDYVSDHEAGEMHRALGEAGGLADAAFAYGLLAQRAVSFSLITARRARESELAQAHAAKQTDQPTP